MAARRKQRLLNNSIRKSLTGIAGLDEVTNGGLPSGRPTLVCGSAGAGKTLMGMEFLVRGAHQFDEPGVFMSFEEKSAELVQNVASLGFDLPALIVRKMLAMDYVRVERSEIEETGEYDLEGLFVRLGYAIDSIGAKRVVLDTIESLFAGLTNHAILRAELRRLFSWLKERGVTAMITAERGEGHLTRHGLEEYVSDCVILLDHRITDQISTRRLRVVKYRGSSHGTNEYPFLIDHKGITVLPITSVGLDHVVSNQRVSSGVLRLDTMLGGKGYFRGSSVLFSGTAGTGKTSFAAHFVDAACRRRERCLYFAFEESPSQIMRNMHSIGIDLDQWVAAGLLQFRASRPTLCGLETHLAEMHKAIEDFKPANVIMDPITNLIAVGNDRDVRAMLVRLIDYLKMRQVTTLFTSLTMGGAPLEATDVGASSLMDTWLRLRDMEVSGERNRGLHVLKSRGMAHSNQVREYLLTDHGVELLDVYVGMGELLTGSARLAQEAQEQAAAVDRQQEMARKHRELARRRQALQAKIALLRIRFEAEEEELKSALGQGTVRERAILEARVRMAASRRADARSRAGQRGNGSKGGKP
jgi:circadian clock protein KaiC